MAADEEPQTTAKSAEDRKAASALASLDVDESASTTNVDSEAVSKAMKNLGGGSTSTSAAAIKASTAAAKTNFKIDPADVALLVEELELVKPRAVELLRAHEGDAVKAMSAFVNANA